MYQDCNPTQGGIGGEELIPTYVSQILSLSRLNVLNVSHQNVIHALQKDEHIGCDIRLSFTNLNIYTPPAKDVNGPWNAHYP